MVCAGEAAQQERFNIDKGSRVGVVVKAMTQIPQICSRMSCYVGESGWLLTNKYQNLEISYSM